jgi:polyhydroxybutyrate depolymerase
VKKSLSLLLFLFPILAAGAGTPTAPAVQASTAVTTTVEDPEFTIDVGELKRRYIVHAPLAGRSSESLPAVLVFHDNPGSAQNMRKQGGWNALGDRQGFIVVYPEGAGRFPSFNAGACCGYASIQQVDDVAFVHLLLEDLKKHLPVDPGRIYAAGMGNGGMMAYRLACEMFDKIAAVGVVGGDLEVDGPKPKRPVPVIHFHGLQDEKVPYGGGAGRRSLQSVVHRSVAQTIGFWVDVNKCRASAVETQTEKDYTMARYEPENGVPGAPVVLYTLPAGGHTWPGGVDLSGYLGEGPLISSVDASALIWRFFEQFNVGGLKKND